VSSPREIVLERIHQACRRSNRNPESVTLIAVSKLQPVSAIQSLISEEQYIFGENYVQELLSKTPQLPAEVQWHMIGPVQKNKVKYLPGQVQCIHTLDSLALAQEIDRRWSGRDLPPCTVLVQINISGEKSKSGIAPEELMALLVQASQLPHLNICGLMTIPPFGDSPEESRPYFRALRELRDVINRAAIPGIRLHELSMGMSDDFEVAIEEGATMIRVGSALFGARPSKPVL
jgi:pyridoxal phosphate enzyme (YggS family)